VALLLAVQLPPVAHAGPAKGLCAMNIARGAVPVNFGLEACVDGGAIWLHNQLSIPVHVTVTGASGSIVTVSSDGSVAALVTRAHYPDPAVLLPGDLARVPLGTGAASVYLADADAAGFYAEALTLSAFLPLGVGVQVYEAIANGIADLVNDDVNYTNCLAGANWVKQIACNLTFQSSVTFHVGKMVVMGVAKGALSIVLNFLNWKDKIGQQVPSLSTLVHSERTLRQAAKTGGGGSTGGGSSPPVGGSTGGGSDPSQNVKSIYVEFANATDYCPLQGGRINIFSGPGRYLGPPVTVSLLANGAPPMAPPGYNPSGFAAPVTIDPKGQVGGQSVGYTLPFTTDPVTITVVAASTPIATHVYQHVCG
jgi:hypothetical protein